MIGFPPAGHARTTRAVACGICGNQRRLVLFVWTVRSATESRSRLGLVSRPAEPDLARLIDTAALQVGLVERVVATEAAAPDPSHRPELPGAWDRPIVRYPSQVWSDGFSRRRRRHDDRTRPHRTTAVLDRNYREPDLDTHHLGYHLGDFAQLVNTASVINPGRLLVLAVLLEPGSNGPGQ